MQQINKPFAPFGAVIHQLRCELKHFNTAPFLYVGRYAEVQAKRSWENGQIALCLPMGSQISHYRWPIDGLNLVVIDTGSMSGLGLKRIAYDLLKLNVEMVVVHTDMKPVVDIFQLKKDLMNGNKEC